MYRSVLTSLGLLLAVAGCGDGWGFAAGIDGGSWYTDKGAPADGSSAQCYGANDCPPGYWCNEFYACVALTPDTGGSYGGNADGGVPPPPDTGAPPLPPELENRVEAPPAVGKRFMYVAVAKQNMVVKIDSVTLKVRAIKVGKDPGALRTVTGQDVAVVLNRKSNTATILRTKKDHSDALITLKVAPNLNNLVISPSGTYAVAFFDVALSKGNISGNQNLQDVTLIKLDPAKELAVDLTVGFKPTGVQFNKGGTAAYVVTENGVSIIDPTATKSAIMPFISLLKDPVKDPKPVEVLVTPDGKVAVAALKGVKGVRAVDLGTRVISDITLGAVPTDLDLTRDGKVAVAVLRMTSSVAVIDVPGDFTDAAAKVDEISVGKYTAGQAELTADGKFAYLFTNAINQEMLLMADLTTRKLKHYPLQKGVRLVQAAPDGKTAVVIHNKVPGTPSKQDGLQTYIDKSYGVSLFSVAMGFAKLQLTGTNPGKLAFAPDAKSAYMLLNDKARGIRATAALDLTSFLVKSITLGSAPVSLGVMPSTKKVYVAQDHHTGRVTFIDMLNHKTSTVTGFELNSQIFE